MTKHTALRPICQAIFTSVVHIFVSGYTMGTMQSGQNQGDSDVFLAKFTEAESCCQLTLREVGHLEQLLQERHAALDLIFGKINPLTP